MSDDFPQTTRRYIPEGSTLHSHRYENLKIHRAKSRLFAAKNPSLQLVLFRKAV
jgi:hypothetical protein